MKKKETKVVIFGDYDTGKTTTLEQLCDRITKVEYNGTTVALDYGNCMVGGEKIHLFATPGHERFKFMLEIISHGLDAAVIVVDNSRGVTLAEKEIMTELEEKNIPYVVFSNKQDLDDSELEIDREVEVIPTVATEGTGLMKGLEILLEKLN
ncbi:ATP/GTP-binding protein [Methanothermobacter wolfeii]|uniref:ATP/GTP-binding protein n=1 Tax=Methanothermobacter wolfeii TaxID=145261 RepID=A0A9E7UML7_METWO|nr:MULTISPECIES: ATP/GTP-binding protein [Methanothermobacter]NLM02518.1 ATP/GTP-binding protein [Methanothermobacter wolfeii]QHN06541.1 GTP-binding protein [Methanothermobacter sp. THM-1]UXH31072.1 ATP/GTP-binding protein [Methanothermobacter wolfeii]SCM57567.1 Miro domain-containing protein MTH_765 [Methanothermobacter wolfeii]